MATRLETKLPEEPSVKVARKASWPKLLKKLGRPSLLPLIEILNREGRERRRVAVPRVWARRSQRHRDRPIGPVSRMVFVC